MIKLFKSSDQGPAVFLSAEIKLITYSGGQKSKSWSHEFLLKGLYADAAPFLFWIFSLTEGDISYRISRGVRGM